MTTVLDVVNKNRRIFVQEWPEFIDGWFTSMLKGHASDWHDTVEAMGMMPVAQWGSGAADAFVALAKIKGREIAAAMIRDMASHLSRIHRTGYEETNEDFAWDAEWKTDVASDAVSERYSLFSDSIGKYVAFSTQRVEQTIRGIPILTPWDQAISMIQAAWSDGYQLESYRVTRMVRTESSWMFHRGMVDWALSQGDSFLKVLVKDGESSAYGVSPIGETFVDKGNKFNHPPFHPNSKTTMFLWPQDGARDSWEGDLSTADWTVL